jgi:hypothetical protein
MSYGFLRWFGYGLGSGVGKALLGGGAKEGPRGGFGPIRNQTEEEILADEKRFKEDEKRLSAEDAK